MFYSIVIMCSPCLPIITPEAVEGMRMRTWNRLFAGVEDSDNGFVFLSGACNIGIRGKEHRESGDENVSGEIEECCNFVRKCICVGGSSSRGGLIIMSQQGGMVRNCIACAVF